MRALSALKSANNCCTAFTRSSCDCGEHPLPWISDRVRDIVNALALVGCAQNVLRNFVSRPAAFDDRSRDLLFRVTLRIDPGHDVGDERRDSAPSYRAGNGKACTDRAAEQRACAGVARPLCKAVALVEASNTAERGRIRRRG